jgi:hypothetical protein
LLAICFLQQHSEQKIVSWISAHFWINENKWDAINRVRTKGVFSVYTASFIAFLRRYWTAHHWCIRQFGGQRAVYSRVQGWPLPGKPDHTVYGKVVRARGWSPPTRANPGKAPHIILIDTDIAPQAADHKAAEADKPVAAHILPLDTVEPLVAAHKALPEQDREDMPLAPPLADRPLAAHTAPLLDIAELLPVARKARHTAVAHSLSLPGVDIPAVLVVPADQKPGAHHNHNSPES